MPFTGILGQDRNIAVLQRSLASGKIAHAYLFEGIEGCGKGTVARAFIEAVFCGHEEGCGTCPSCRKVAAGQHPDLHRLEPDGAFIKIDQVRELQRQLSLRPHEAPRKACLISTAERLNAAAANALLKTLEEPPGDALLILLTSQVGAMLPTVLSRCQVLHFPALPEETIAELLRRGGTEPEAARIAASLAGGSLDQALAIGSAEALAERRSFLERVFTLSRTEIAPLFATAEELSRDRELTVRLLDILLSFLRDVLILQAGGNETVHDDLQPLIAREAQRSPRERTMVRIGHVLEAVEAIKRNVNLRLALDVLFMRLADR